MKLETKEYLRLDKLLQHELCIPYDNETIYTYNRHQYFYNTIIL